MSRRRSALLVVGATIAVTSIVAATRSAAREADTTPVVTDNGVSTTSDAR